MEKTKKLVSTLYRFCLLTSSAFDYGKCYLFRQATVNDAGENSREILVVKVNVPRDGDGNIIAAEVPKAKEIGKVRLDSVDLMAAILRQMSEKKIGAYDGDYEIEATVTKKVTVTEKQ